MPPARGGKEFTPAIVLVHNRFIPPARALGASRKLGPSGNFSYRPPRGVECCLRDVAEVVDAAAPHLSVRGMLERAGRLSGGSLWVRWGVGSRQQSVAQQDAENVADRPVVGPELVGGTRDAAPPLLV